MNGTVKWFNSEKVLDLLQEKMVKMYLHISHKSNQAVTSL